MNEIAPGIRQLDTLLGGIEGLTAGFLIEGSQPALVEAGAQSSAPTVVAALEHAGLGPGDIRWLIVTHIHLDHAGAVGDLAAAFPNATVVVHQKGARHLADPARLIESAGRVYGPLLDSLYGRLLPVPADRLLAAPDGLTLEVGDGRRLRIVDSPGHAKHHQAILEEASGTLMVGDAVGVQLSNVDGLRPATPPPDFDLEQAIQSLHRFRALHPKHLVLTHFGPVEEIEATLAAAEDGLRHWVEVARGVIENDPQAGIDEVTRALDERFGTPADAVGDAVRSKLEVLNGIRSNAAGLVRYLAAQAEARESG
jgi:glyoxylase-like metal-dependent hydrolase (beta-lactamase superfamily II)